MELLIKHFYQQMQLKLKEFDLSIYHLNKHKDRAMK